MLSKTRVATPLFSIKRAVRFHFGFIGAEYIDPGFAVFSGRMQRRRSTLWFVLSAAWAVLLVLNLLRHREKNAIVIGVAVLAFVVTGIIYWRRDNRAMRR